VLTKSLSWTEGQLQGGGETEREGRERKSKGSKEMAGTAENTLQQILVGNARPRWEP